MARSVVALSLAAVAASQPLPSSCQGTPNTIPIWTAAPTFVANVTNGLRFVSAPSNSSPPLTVLHLYGSPYEMGYAYGELMRNEIQSLVPQVIAYMQQQVNQSLPNGLPPAIVEALMTYGLEFALNLTYEATKPYTPAHHYDMLQGIADGSGVDVTTVTHMSLIPELIKASCSMMGASGPATAGGDAKGGMIQLRALDWDTDGPFQQYPVLLTFHPSAGNGVAFTSMSWAGFTGAITGFSSSGIAVSEKVWDAYTGVQNIFGYVWTFLLQDILQYDGDADQALSRIATANRTCSIWIGIGDANTPAFKIVGYSNQLVNIYNDRNFPAYPNHDLFPGLIFLNKHVQPSSEPCMNDLMHTFYGRIDAVTTLTYITALEQTGDMHIAVFDFANSLMYVANAGVSDANGNAVPAYTRQFIRFDMKKLWSQTLTDF